MIPEFNDHGYLPPGIHPATLDEITERFGTESELRRVQMESLRWMIELAWKAGVLQIVVNGSFVTDKYEPNDVDCVLLVGPDYPQDPIADSELQSGLPFITMELGNRKRFAEFTQMIFATDRDEFPKGLIEVLP